MDQKPNTDELQKPRRRWFQFRLRTLLVGVAVIGIVLGAACAYVAHEAKIVRERKLTRERIRGQEDRAWPFWGSAPPQDFPPLVRRLLGDVPIKLIRLKRPIADEELQSLAAMFPEADILDGERVTEATIPNPGMYGPPPP